MNGGGRGRVLRPFGDIGLALAVVVVLWLPALGAAGAAARWAGVALAAVVVAGTAARWRLPLASPVAVFAATGLAAVLGVTDDPFVAAAWALYPAAVRWGSRSPWFPAALFVAVVAGATMVGAPATTAALETVRHVTAAVALLAGSWIVGSLVGRQARAAAEAARAQADRRAAEHRLRVAREVHDVVAHTLGTIGIEAGVARHVASTPPEEMRRTLASIESSARQALGQIQSLLRTLRDDEEIDRTPTPGLTDLPGLGERATRAGSPTTVTVAGTPGLDAGTELAVYRIVQEAVTNSVRHAPGAACRVEIRADAGGTVVTVRDTGPGRPAGSTDGNGLAGLRERAALAGGTVNLGNHPDGGFQVRVSLPRKEPDG
ncbi:sensor histidine kinase [Polymorphospora sp. NPDC051019]|uniref:sensor histidine kinase n=1 Tax=Polymorphospora sp. NPDC051019 TaxID=3155725 RepID=UPI00344125D5